MNLILTFILALSAVGTPVQAVKGYATWYDTCRFCAAASGELQDAMGSDWKGRYVTVSSGGHSVLVRLDTGCACGPRHGVPTVIDLDDRAFQRLAPLSQGIVDVTVSWETRPSATLPPTDVAISPTIESLASLVASQFGREP